MPKRHKEYFSSSCDALPQPGTNVTFRSRLQKQLFVCLPAWIWSLQWKERVAARGEKKGSFVQCLAAGVSQRGALLLFILPLKTSCGHSMQTGLQVTALVCLGYTAEVWEGTLPQSSSTAGILCSLRERLRCLPSLCSNSTVICQQQRFGSTLLYGEGSAVSLALLCAPCAAVLWYICGARTGCWVRHQLCLARARSPFLSCWLLLGAELLCELGNARLAREQRPAQPPHPGRMEQSSTAPQLGVRWSTWVWVCSAQPLVEGGVSLGLPQGHTLGHRRTSPLQLAVLTWRPQQPSEMRSRATALCPGTSLSSRLAVSGCSPTYLGTW